MIELNKIYCGDCLEVLKTFESNTIDCCISSPPYNLGNKHHTGKKYHNPYNDDVPENEYQNNQIDVLNELFRVIKNNGSLIYNHKNRIKNKVSITPYEWILKSKWILKQEWIWFNGSQNFDKIRFYPMTERLYWLVKDKETTLQNNINAHDLFNWKAEGTNNLHTRTFPYKMIQDLLLCFPDYKIILDPFAGSGTTLKVAKDMGRNYIGIELNPEYIKLIEKRLELDKYKLAI